MHPKVRTAASLCQRLLIKEGTMEIYEMTALQVAEKIRNKEITSVDAVESVAKAVEQRDKTYNCYASICLFSDILVCYILNTQ